MLTLTSPQLKLRVLQEESPYSGLHWGWQLCESATRPTYRRDEETFLTYVIRMDRDVGPGEDPGSLYIEGRYLSRALTRAWVYATGLPLGDRGYDLFSSKVALPAAWSSNAEEVIPSSDWQILTTDLSHTGLYRRVALWPLRAAVAIAEDIANADDIVQQVVSYHCAALETREPTLHLLLFAQGLAVARELLPGRTDTEKERRLPSQIQDAKRRSLHWLLGAGNTRRETRHVITKVPDLELHPAMDDEEIEDYQHDADLLLRYVVSAAIEKPFADPTSGALIVAT